MTDLARQESELTPSSVAAVPSGGLRSRAASHLSAPLQRNAYSLVASGMLTSVLGLLYWLIVARRYPAQDVGLGSAAVAAMTLLANGSALGLQNGFVKLIPRAGSATRRFVGRSMVLAAGLAALSAVVFLAGLRWWAPSLEPLLRESPIASVGFVVAVVVWSAFTLQDTALIGLRRATFVPLENLIFSILKIVSVIVLSTGLVRWGVFASWGLSAAVAVVAVSGVLLPRLLNEAVATSRGSSLPTGAALRRQLAGEHLSILMWMGTIEVLPLIVLHRLGAVANAHYYLAVQITYALFLLPSSFGVAMTAEGAADPQRIQHHLRKSAQHLGDLLVPLVALIVVAAPLGLRVFGQDYSDAASSALRWMVLAALPFSLTQLMMGVARVQERIKTVTLTYLAIGIMVVGLSWLLMGSMGLTGVGLAWFISHLLVAVVVVPVQLRRSGIDVFDRTFGTVVRRRRHRRSLRSGTATIRRRLAVLTPVLGTVRSTEVSFSNHELTVATIRSRERAPVTLSLAQTSRSGAELLRAADTMAVVRAEIPSIAAIVPRPIETGDIGATETYLVETMLDGDTAASRLAERRLSLASIGSALGALAELHRATARQRTIDASWLARWVDEPVSRLQSLVEAPAERVALDAVARQLRAELGGRVLTTGRVHGDLHPGNLRFELGGSGVSGLLGWRHAAGDGLPELDVYDLLLSLHLADPTVDVSAVAGQLMTRSRHSITDRAILDEAVDSLPNSTQLSPWTLTALAWISRADKGVRQSDSSTSRWQRRSIVDTATTLAAAGLPAQSAAAEVTSAGASAWPVERDLELPGPEAAHRRSIQWPTPSPATAPVSIAPWQRWLGSTHVVIPIAVVLWVLAIRDIDLRSMSDLGLLSVIRPIGWLGLALLLVSIVASISRPVFRVGAVAAPLVTFLVLVHGTPAAIYGSLRYSWAWKHVGIVEYLLRNGSVDADIDRLAVYHQWPGFFSAAGLITRAVGADNALAVATIAPVFFNLAFMLLVVFVLRTLTSDLRVVWLATTLFFVSNWIGQDYFSPQAYAFVMHLAVLGLVLQRFSRDDRSRVGRSWNTGWVTAVVCLLLTAIATSHQLTPVMIAASLAALALTRRAEAWKFVAFAVVINLTWAATYARPFVADQLPGLVERFGNLRGNAADTFIDSSGQSSGHALVSTMGRFTVAVIVLLALIGFVRRWLAGRREWTAGVLAAAPTAALLNNYGGEVLFRVVLFGLPFLAYLAALAIVPAGSGAWSVRRSAIAIAMIGVLVAGFTFGYYGKERQYYFTDDEVAAVQFLQDEAPANTLVVSVNTNFPDFWEGYERFTVVAVSLEDDTDLQGILANPEATMVNWLDNDRYAATYLLINRAQLAQVVDVGEVPVDEVLEFTDEVLGSPSFEKVFETPDATVLRLSSSITGAGS